MPAKSSTVPSAQVVCAYCLKVCGVRAGTDRPVRHGWSSTGGRGGANGQLGAHHAGRCRGADFPHLGVSSSGLEAAIADMKSWHVEALTARAELESRPTLIYTKEDGIRGVTIEVPVVDGQDEGYARNTYGTWHPSYDYLYRGAVAERDGLIRQIEARQAFLEMKLATWTPNAE